MCAAVDAAGTSPLRLVAPFDGIDNGPPRMITRGVGESPTILGGTAQESDGRN